MKFIVDTNVLAYYLLRTEPFYNEVRNFWLAVEEAWAPDSWRAEFLNLLWLAVRAEVISPLQAEKRLFLAERLITQSIPTRQLTRTALHLAVTSEHPAYDTLFVALAMLEDVPLATCDQSLLKKFPDWAKRPESISISG